MMRVFSNDPAREIMLHNMSPSRILHHILGRVENSKEYLYLIMGRSGPTGKTWLAESLKNNGYDARDISEDVCHLVEYRGDERNHYYVDPGKKLVTIVLNKRLHVCRGEG